MEVGPEVPSIPKTNRRIGVPWVSRTIPERITALLRHCATSATITGTPTCSSKGPAPLMSLTYVAPPARRYTIPPTAPITDAIPELKTRTWARSLLTASTVDAPTTAAPKGPTRATELSKTMLVNERVVLRPTSFSRTDSLRMPITHSTTSATTSALFKGSIHQPTTAKPTALSTTAAI